jgi:hypothetical protein
VTRGGDAGRDFTARRKSSATGSKPCDKGSKPVLNFHGQKLVHRIDSPQSPLKVLRDVLRIVGQVTA